MILLFYEAQLLFTCHLGAQYTLILPKRKANITAQNAKFFAELRKEAEVFPLRPLRLFSVPFAVKKLPQRTLSFSQSYGKKERYSHCALCDFTLCPLRLKFTAENAKLRRVTQRSRGIPFAHFAILLCAL
jgi:hypothetical protein